MARLVSLSILIVLIVFLGITFFQVVAPFLLPLFLAAVMTIIFRPLFHYFLVRTKQRVRLAAGLTTTAILAILLLPLLVGISIGSLQLYALTKEGQLDIAVKKVRAELQAEIERGKDSLFKFVQPRLPNNLEIEDSDEQLQAQRDYFDSKLDLIQGNVRNQLNALAARSLGVAGGKTFDVLGAAISLLIGLIMFMIALYYFFADGPALLRAAEGLIPVHAIYQRQLLNQFDKVIRAVVLATFLAALGQGLATAVLLAFVGFNHFFIFFVVATLASLIPLAGTWLVWGPCAIWLATNGQWGSAIFLGLFGSIGVGTLDNVIKTYVLQSDTKLHPLLAFVSVLGGLKVMGLWGVFVGPIVACCLHALIRIFNTELKEFSKEKYSGLLGRSDQKTPSRIEGDSPSRDIPAGGDDSQPPAQQEKQAQPIAEADSKQTSPDDSNAEHHTE